MESNQVMIHVRFAPNGAVTEIGERPPSLAAHDWFNLLSRSTVNCYETLSGGRGIFRLPREKIDQLKSAAV